MVPPTDRHVRNVAPTPPVATRAKELADAR
jgi:hypothetical protein